METLLLQVALIFGEPCDHLPIMDSEHWQRPAVCEMADAVLERVDSLADELGWTWTWEEARGCDAMAIPSSEGVR